jgi:TolB-like protein
MMDRLKLFVFTLLLFGMAQAEKPIIAVADLQNRGLNPDEAFIVTDRLRQEIQNNGKFRMMERSMMESILKEQGFQNSGACDSEGCEVELGKLLGVDYMIVGSVGKIGKTYTISSRLIQVETGEILQTLSEDVRGEVDDLIRGPVRSLGARISLNKNSTQDLSPVANPIAPQKSSSSKISKKLWAQIGLGVMASVATGVALYYNSEIANNNDEMDYVMSEYKKANATTTVDTWSQYRQDYEDYNKSAKSASTSRNIWGSVAGVALIGFGASFAF